MAKAKLIKNQLVNDKEGVIISQESLEERDEEFLKSFENGPEVNEHKDDAFLSRMDSEKKDYKKKTFTTDRNWEVFDFEYQGSKYSWDKDIFKNMKITFSGKPSIENAQWLSDLIMNK